MKAHWCIFAGVDHWRVAVVRDGHVVIESTPFTLNATVDVQAEALRVCLASQGYDEAPAVLACPSSWFLCAAFSTADLQRARRRQALSFRLEEHLPVAAEDVVADFVESSGSALGVCSEAAKLRAIVEAMESRGVRVRHICPASMLAAAHVITQQSSLDAVLARFAAPEGGDLIELHQGKPTAWSWLANDGAESRQRLAAWAEAQHEPARIALLACAQRVVEFDTSQYIEQVRDPSTFDEAAARQAARVLDHAAPVWIDLRRDALAASDQFESLRRPVIMLVASLVLMMLCVIGASQWRGRAYAAERERLIQQQVEVFRSAMPNQRVPASIKGRLTSEHQKLAGLSGRLAQGGGAAGSGRLVRTSALLQLQAVLLSLPGDLRFRILDLSLQPDRIRIDGQARSHAEAEQIASSLRETGAFEVEPPKTEALKEGGVSFVFSAKPRMADNSAKGAR